MLFVETTCLKPGPAFLLLVTCVNLNHSMSVFSKQIYCKENAAIRLCDSLAPHTNGQLLEK